MTADQLAQRIADYCERPRPTADAIAHAINVERLAEVICFTRPNRTFRQVFEEVYGRKL